ncbi:MAG: hypothetical protein FWC84_04755 [Alphaproteobacteria bacterium]|nr:hypothetical protein [Alphaproteobacteria bacterium]
MKLQAFHQPLRILVTGFGRFPGAHSNPTEWLIKALGLEQNNLARLRIKLHLAVLPVDYSSLMERLDRLEQEVKPDVILHFGLATKRRAFCLEMRALNRLNLLRCDALGHRPKTRAVVPGGAQILHSRFPATMIEAAWHRAGLLGRLSHHPGAYLCNAALYLSLAISAAETVGFIHVPKIGFAGQQPCATSLHARPQRAELVRAALIAIHVTAMHSRRRRPHVALPTPLDPACALP